MKKYLLLFLVAFTTTAFPQDKKLNIFVGLASTNMESASELSNSQMKDKTGISLGANYEVLRFFTFSLRPQIEFSQRGYKAYIEPYVSPLNRSEKLYKNPSGDVETNINYIMLSIYLNYEINSMIGKFNLKAAPRYDILLGGKSEPDPRKIDTFKNSFGGSIGVSYSPDLSLSFSPFIEIVYHFDIIKPFENESGGYLANKAFNINLGISL